LIPVLVGCCYEHIHLFSIDVSGNERVTSCPGPGIVHGRLSSPAAELTKVDGNLRDRIAADTLSRHVIPCGCYGIADPECARYSRCARNTDLVIAYYGWIIVDDCRHELLVA
jgi:hypothetical protein